VDDVPTTNNKSHPFSLRAMSPIKGGISPNHTTSGLNNPPHLLYLLDPAHSSPPQRGSFSRGITSPSEASSSADARGVAYVRCVCWHDWQRVVKMEPCISIRSSLLAAFIAEGRVSRTRRERSSTFCVICKGGADEGVTRA